jgi:hypothetical protein
MISERHRLCPLNVYLIRVTHVQWWIQRGALGASPPPPRRKSQAHILTYAFQGYLTSRYHGRSAMEANEANASLLKRQV